MLLTLLAWIYITFVCWSWGYLTFTFFAFLAGERRKGIPEVSIICIIGLSAIAVVAGFLSLIIPLGLLTTQLFFFIPAIVNLFFRRGRNFFFRNVTAFFSSLRITTGFLFAFCLLLLLVMSVWEINHPDTLGYHAQVIKWINKYPVVPGLVHLHNRFGFQSSWFIVSSLFSFNFIFPDNLIFINTTVLVWFFAFVIKRITNFYSAPNQLLSHSFLWLLLLAFSLWHYTQTRLTATSASPDFIAALYLWLICYFFLSKRLSLTSLLLLIFFIFTAITLKLSTALIALLAAYLFIYIISKKKYRIATIAILLGLFILTPFIIRNFITTGYLLFPLASVDLVNPDWKYDKSATTVLQLFIKSYARIPHGSTAKEIINISSMNLSNWVPQWWHNKTFSDAILLVSLALLLLSAPIYLKPTSNGKERKASVIAFLCLLSIFFWFINAPDIRFATGFMIPLSGLLMLSFFKKLDWLTMHKPIFYFLLFYCLLIGLLSYNIYRFLNFFDKKNLLYPTGIKFVPYKIDNCNGINLHLPITTSDCRNIPLPCTYNSCQSFLPRGKAVEDGFKSK